MSLVLTLQHRQNSAARQTKILESGTISLGRGTGNDWVLDDPDRQLSKMHCIVSLENGRYLLTDLSTNGTFVNGAREAVGRDGRVVLTDGDSFRLGDYTITVAEQAASPTRAMPRQTDAPDPLGGDELDDPFDAPAPAGFAYAVAHTPPPQAARIDPFDQAAQPGRAVSLDADPFASPKPLDDWLGPAQPDNVDAASYMFEAPKPLPVTNFDDLDFDALLGDLPPGQQPAPPPPPPPLARPSPDPFGADPLDADLAPPHAPIPVAAPPPPPPPAHTPSPAPSNADDARALAAFLDGAGVPDLRLGKADPEESLRAAGAILRAMVEGLRDVLMSRAAIKNELRVEQTMLRARDNNALKFSVTVEEAVAALLMPDRPGYKPPLAAAHEAYADIRSHEMAVMAGVQTALIGLLKRFDPEALEKRLTPSRLGILAGSQKSRMWELFCTTYTDIAREAEDDFQSVFGREFARAYDAQMKKL